MKLSRAKGLQAKKSKKGFTLIELVVVIAILGILAAILIPVISGFIQRANVAADGANARNLFNSAAILLATDRAVTRDNLDDFIALTSDATTINSASTATSGIARGAIGSDTWSVGYTGDVVYWAQYGGAVYYLSGTLDTGS